MMPLEDILVLDLTRLLPGPYCSMILADFGADVVKIEAPEGGDYMRDFEPLMKAGSAFYYAVNRNKKSLVLNLKEEEERSKFIRLIERADVLMEGFRPGVMDKLGLGYDRLKEVKADLIWCSITGFGQESPYKDLPGHDINYNAIGGVLDQIGKTGDAPALPGIQVADLSAGFWAAIGIMAALIQRDRKGEGCFIDLSMMDTVLSWLPLHVMAYVATGKAPTRGDTLLSGRCPCYHIYETSEGSYLTLGALEEKFWKAFCNVIGRRDLIPLQLSNEPHVIENMEKIFKGRTKEEWMDLVRGKDVPLFPVKSIPEVLDDPHVKARELIWKMRHPIEGELLMVAPPCKFSTFHFSCRKLPPTLDEDRAEIEEKYLKR